MTFLGAPAAALGTEILVDSGTAELEARIERVLNGLRPPVSIEDEPSATLADRMKALRIPGVSIAVMHGGAIDWARGFGTTGNGDATVSESTLFQAASVSKPVAAVAALTLVQAGRLDLDTEVGTYLKNWKLPPTPLSQDEKVTIRRLLNHTAGTTVHGFGGYVSGTPVPSLLKILNGEPPANSAPIAVDLIPGTQFRYSGGGYTVLQQIINDATDQAFPDFLREAVLAPVGMRRSSFEQPLLSEQAAEAALPHDADGNALDGGPYIYPELAAAGLWTTATDLALFALALLDAWQEKPGSLLAPFITQQMFLPGLGQYGLGLIVVGNAPRQRFYHDGANAGYQCVMLVDAAGDGAVVMTNSDNGHLLIWDVVRAVANEYGWHNWPSIMRRRIAIDPSLLNGFVGDFRLSPTTIVRVFEEDGHLYLQTTDQDKLEIFPESSRIFFATVVDMVIIFDTDGSTPATRMIIHQYGRDVTATRIA